MMKYKLLAFIGMLLAVLSRDVAGQDVSGTFDVVCVVSDEVAEPPPGNKISLIRKKESADPCTYKAPKDSRTFHLGDHINLLVEHPRGKSFDEAGEPNPTDLVLYLDGRALPGTYAEETRSESEPETEEEDQVTWTVLRYELTRDLSTDQGRRNWTEIVTGPKFGKLINVSTGLEDGQAVPTDAQIKLIILSGWRLALAVAVGLALATIFFLLLFKTGALRDKTLSNPEPLLPTERPYSLSRVQALLWTILTIYAFLFVYYLTGEYRATIPGSLIMLMGISLGTAATAVAVDSATAKTKGRKTQAPQGSSPRPSFWHDLFSNEGGAGLHRVQFGLWTAVLMTVFVYEVFQNLAMPDFDTTLLALMGLSSGTYAGLKIPENKSAADAAAQDS